MMMMMMMMMMMISEHNTRDMFNRFSKKITAVRGTWHIISKVLQSETWGLSRGVHHWFKRSTRGNETCDKR